MAAFPLLVAIGGAIAAVCTSLQEKGLAVVGLIRRDSFAHTADSTLVESPLPGARHCLDAFTGTSPWVAPSRTGEPPRSNRN
jgi:hypothetical protein